MCPLSRLSYYQAWESKQIRTPAGDTDQWSVLMLGWAGLCLNPEVQCTSALMRMKIRVWQHVNKQMMFDDRRPINMYKVNMSTESFSQQILLNTYYKSGATLGTE